MDKTKLKNSTIERFSVPCSSARVEGLEEVGTEEMTSSYSNCHLHTCRDLQGLGYAKPFIFLDSQGRHL